MSLILSASLGDLNLFRNLSFKMYTFIHTTVKAIKKSLLRIVNLFLKANFKIK